MRIALDATYSVGSALSGVGVYSREILHGLAAIDPSTEWEWFYRWQGYRRTRSHVFPSGVRRRLLTDTLGSRSADLFHGMNQRLPTRRFRRQISTFHDLFVMTGDYSTPEFRQRFTQQARHAAANSDLIIAVSAFTASQVQDLLGIPASRIRVVPHGVLPRAIPDLPREKVVLCVGALQRRKNQATLVRAFAAMPPDWRLVLAGSEGFEAAETRTAIAESPAGDRIAITGYLSESEIAAWYGRASIFAFPSLDEGFGIPILEAMSAGIPVITGNRSALPEVAGDAAILVYPKDIGQLAHELRQLAENETRKNELATLGRARAAQFPWRRAVEETLAVYRELR